MIKNRNGIEYMISLFKKKNFLYKKIIALSLGLKNPIFVELSMIKLLRNADEVKKLRDQSLLLKIIKIASKRSVRETAVKTLTDQKLLAEIAYSDNRITALETLNIMSVPLNNEAKTWLRKPKKKEHTEYENNFRFAIIQGMKKEHWPIVISEPSIYGGLGNSYSR